jgi:eukaryotic-like serine/threonine-protein kinase
LVVVGEKRRWKLGDRFDSGGFGQIYDASSDGQPAVVKLVPKAPGADREFLMEELSGVRNVIPLWDRGETDSHWALVMPRADKSLRDHLSERAGQGLDLNSALSIMIDIAETLVDLAAKQIVHRDLKPENVLLFNGRWCLTDFGISRYAEKTTAPETQKYAMSKPYAAPEQWRFQRASSATDVYALGVVGYEILTGHRPFNGPDFREQHLHGQAPALTSVPAPLGALLDQCLSKSPGSRPTPADLLKRLQQQASTAPMSDGLAALQEANRAQVVRLAEDARLASEAETEAERRAALVQDAGRQLHSMSVTLSEAIRSAAPAASESAVQAQHMSGLLTSGWRMRLGGAKLDFAPPTIPEEAPSLPFDVIVWLTIAVIQPPNQLGYQGRSHNLWFCDAQECGRYRWYETAFMDQPLMRSAQRPIDPFAASPTSKEAKQALLPGMGAFQVAWPFTPVDLGEMDEFIGRWAGWFAQAATGSLAYPSQMPERPIAGSWRNQ